MIPNKGRYLDCNPINQPPGTWRGGKNFVVNRKKAAYVVEPGTDLTATNFPFTIAKPIGSAVFPDGSYVQFADGINGGKDRIGIVEPNGVYTDVIVDDALNLWSLFPIRSYEIDYNAFPVPGKHHTERIVGFTDKYNNFRVLNVDNPPFARNPDNSLVDPTNISDLEGFPKFKLPIYTFTVNQVGGAIYSGAYSACFAYEGLDGTRTPNSPPSKMIYITDDATTGGNDKFDGCPPRTRTSKSITFNVTNVDTRYDKIVLIVVKKMGGVTEVAAIKKADITGTTISITYVGSETETSMSPDAVLTPRPLYTTVGCMAQLNSQLYLGDLVAEKDIDYQKYANNIRIHYNTKLVNVNNINDNHKNVLPGGFSHGAVYAFYIAFVLKNGSWSRAFHIPGRAPIIGGTSTIETNITRDVSIVPPSNPGDWDPASFSEAVVNNTSGYFNSSIKIFGTANYNGVQIVVEHHDSRVVFQHTFNGYQSGSTVEAVTSTVTASGDRDNSLLTTYTGAAATGIPAGTKTFQVEDTTNKPAPTYTTIDGTIHSGNLAGPTNMGFWENQDEKYPNGFEAEPPASFDGKPVRHHVFPTIRKCKQLHYNSVAGYGRDQLDVLGIDVSNVSIPADIQDKVEGWGIFYARRDYSSSNTLGTDIYLVSHLVDAHGEENLSMAWSAGGNWRARFITGGDNAISQSTHEFSLNYDYARGHNFELQKDMPAIGAAGLFIDFELRLRKTNLQDSYLTYNKAGGHIAGSGESNSGGRGQNAGMLVDYTDPVRTTVLALPSTQLVRKVDEFKYYPANILDGNVSTLKNEDTISLKIFNGKTYPIPLVPSEVHVNSVDRGYGMLPTTLGLGSSFPGGGEETYLISYKQIKTNVYDEFDNQLLTLTDTLCLPNETEKRGIRGGDSFVSIRSFLSVSPRHHTDFGRDGGTTIVRAHINEGRYNVGLRHEIVGEPTTKHYPKIGANEFWSDPAAPDGWDGVKMIFELGANPNKVAYNIDYNATNTYVQLMTYTANQRLTNEFPYRVIRGGTNAGARADINGWKTFLAADYYESNRNRGRVSDLFVLDDILFIQHLYGLFRTLGTEKLSLSTTEVYLGSGDVFAQKPKELITTKTGYLGCQDIFSGVTYPGGRFWADQSQGRIITINKNGVNEISQSGMYEFFRDNLKIANLDPDHPESPIDLQGIIAAYDPKYDRMILTKKSDINPFTLSYSTDSEQNYWAFDHDYIPDYLFSTSTNFFGYKNNKIHSFNSVINEARYFEGAPQTSEIELIFNEQNNRNKEFFNINWISEVYNKLGIKLDNKTLTAVHVKTSYQDSGVVSLVPFAGFGINHNIRRYKNVWNFNRFKDLNDDVYKRKTMLDNYCSINFIFDNALNLDGTQNSLYLYLLNAKALLAEL